MSCFHSHLTFLQKHVNIHSHTVFFNRSHFNWQAVCCTNSNNLCRQVLCTTDDQKLQQWMTHSYILVCLTCQKFKASQWPSITFHAFGMSRICRCTVIYMPCLWCMLLYSIPLHTLVVLIPLQQIQRKQLRSSEVKDLAKLAAAFNSSVSRDRARRVHLSDIHPAVS